MRIRARHRHDSPDINFIPLIDVLLVIVIFLAVSTTFTQERALDILLPQAQTDAQVPDAISISISADGRIAINEKVLPDATVETIRASLRILSDNPADATVIIRADANASHQSVVTTMQAAKQAGFQKLGLAAQVGE